MWKLRKVNTTILSLVVLFIFTSGTIQSQEFILNNQESSLTVLGTSNVHDWDLNAESQTGKIAFKNLDEGQIESCYLEVKAEGLKSGKSSMDKNTFKALKTDGYKTIVFRLVEAKEVVSKGNGVFSVKTSGDLTIAGVKKRISLDFNVNTNGGKINLTGEKKIKMTDFNVEPPKALFGTITTGDEVTIKFSTILK